MITNGKCSALRRIDGEPAPLSFGFRSWFLPAVLGAAAALLLFGCGGPFPSNEPIESGLELPIANPYAPYRIEIVGHAAFDGGGKSVSGAGDVNGNGVDDVIVGAFSSNAAYVVYGAPRRNATVNVDGQGATPAFKIGFQIVGEFASDRTGWSVSGAGDVNGDGIGDVIVGAPHKHNHFDENGEKTGAAYVIFGSGEERTTVDLAALGGPAPADMIGFKIRGENAFDRAGWSVSGAGDVNDDTIDDVIVGALYNAHAGVRVGAAYVVYGVPPTATANVDLDDLGGTNPNNTLSFKIVGEAALRLAGHSVSGAGDMNIDGRDDIIVGAPDYFATLIPPNGGTTAGAAYVIYGVPPTATATVNLDDLGGPNPNNHIGFKIAGENTLDNAGYSVSGAGDVNGDGVPDVIVGAPQNGYGDTLGGYSGAAYVIYGRNETNIDLSDLAGSTPDNEIGFKISLRAETDRERLGRSVSKAGDFNRDGIDDVIVGAPGHDARGPFTGAAYLVRGKGGGQGSVFLYPDDILVTGEAADEVAGFSVAGAGDFNEDGTSDVIVGTYRDAPDGNVPGAAYVVAPWTFEYTPRPAVPASPPSIPPQLEWRLTSLSRSSSMTP